MPTGEHLVKCGAAGVPSRQRARTTLSLDARHGNVHLEIGELSARLAANIPDVLVDLLEIASYVYAADSAVPRGGGADGQMGARWRRRFRLAIPVRVPQLWSSKAILSPLVEILGFLSEDDYKFEFERLVEPPDLTDYFEFPDADVIGFNPDEVLLFSGGLDSLAGVVEELTRGRKVALVSHRSSTKISAAQDHLVTQLQARFGRERILHVPIWMTLGAQLTKEYTHRTRSFLFAALGAVTACLFGKSRCSFFENGVTSLNLPPVAQVVGARASRTTHPQALGGFGHMMAVLLGHRFDIKNPFFWLTKAEVVERVAIHGCRDLIRHTRSCTRVHDMTVLHTHCGRCSQCIDRRIAVIAAGQEAEDPVESYKTDLFLGERPQGPDREMVLAYVRSASAINQMTDIAFFAHYGETSRVVGSFPEPADAIGRRIFDLHKRHAATICNVIDRGIASYASELREQRLPVDCLLSLVVGRGEGVAVYTAPSSPLVPAMKTVPEIRIGIDPEQQRVVLDRWGELTGVSAAVIIALADPFRRATHDELAPERYPFTETCKLMSQTNCDAEETLRRRILRCRNRITALASRLGDRPPSFDAVIESSQRHGYRLNPDHIRLVAVYELARAGAGHASHRRGHASHR